MKDFRILAFGFLVLFCFLLTVPLSASAHPAQVPYWGPLVQCGAGGCKSICDIFDTAQHIIYFLMTLTLFIIGPIMIVAGGIMILISGGSSERFGSGKKMITGAIVGILITLGAFVIVNTILWALVELPKTAGVGGTTPTVRVPWPTIECKPNIPTDADPGYL